MEKGFENAEQQPKNDCIAAGEMIVGSMVTPDYKVGSIHIPEKSRKTVLMNVMKVASVGPDVELRVEDSEGMQRPLAADDLIYVRKAVTIPGTVDLNWIMPEDVIGIKSL